MYNESFKAKKVNRAKKKIRLNFLTSKLFFYPVQAVLMQQYPRGYTLRMFYSISGVLHYGCFTVYPVGATLRMFYSISGGGYTTDVL